MTRRALARWLRADDSLLPTSGRTTHLHVVGQPGMGKSKALESWAMQDILAGRGVGVIDPHGDLFHNLLARLSRHPQHWQRTVVVDPADPAWAVNIDPLRAMSGTTGGRLALFVTDIVVKLWGVDASAAPRLVWLLSNSFLALSDLDLTLLHLPRFLLDRAWRESLLPRLTREGVLGYFHREFPDSSAGARQWALPALNRLGHLLHDPDLRPMLAGGRPLDFRALIDGQKVLLVNLSKGLLGEGASALLGAFLVAQIQKAALARAGTRYRPPFYLTLDEFQHYTADNVVDVLSEARKYALALTLAHQYLDQLSPNLRAAVLNTAGTLVAFRVGYRDGLALARALFPGPDFLTRSERVVRSSWVGPWPRTGVETRRRPLGWEGLAGLLASQAYRQFWARRKGARHPWRGRTLDMPDLPLDAERREAIAALREASGQRYGYPKGSHQPCEEVIYDPNGHRPEGVPFWGG